jgi:hypothetical protein
MIPIEYLAITLIVVLGIVGAARGLARELGVTTIVLLSLFVLKFAWKQLGERGIALVGDRAPADTVMALYYIIIIVFVAIISYEGFTLAFPVREMRGVSKGIAGLPGGLLNGYLIFGTIWDVAHRADYFGLKVPFECYGSNIAISDCLTDLHNVLVQYLPITYINEFVMLILGMILLLAIVLK